MSSVRKLPLGPLSLHLILSWSPKSLKVAIVYIFPILKRHRSLAIYSVFFSLTNVYLHIWYGIDAYNIMLSGQ